MGRPRIKSTKSYACPISLSALEVANLFPVGPWPAGRQLDVRIIHAVEPDAPNQPLCGIDGSLTPRTQDWQLVTCDGCRRMAGLVNRGA